MESKIIAMSIGSLDDPFLRTIFLEDFLVFTMDSVFIERNIYPSVNRLCEKYGCILLL